MKICAVIPTYNRADALRKALESVFCQSYAANEIVVVDDGSNDDTKAMIAEEFPGVDYYYQENQGVSSARNLGIEKSNSEWLAFLDSDDQWLPDKLAQQVKILSEQPDIKVCHTEEIWIRNNVRVNAMKKHAKKGGWIFQHCLPLCAMSPSSIVLHRAVLDDVGYFDTDLPACEDYDLWLRITAKYPVAFIESPQIKKYGGHNDQLSRKYWGMDRFRIKALQKILAQKTLSSEDRQAAIEMLINKASVYANGARKRQKLAEAIFYEQLIQNYL